MFAIALRVLVTCFAMPRRGTTSPRHMAGVGREDATSAAAGFDVEAAFDPDFDFDALFAADDTDTEAQVAKRGVPRHRIAIAVAVTLAALPLLLLDNFQANASTPARVDASAAHLDLAPTGPPLALDSVATPYVSIAAPTTVTPVTVPAAVVFNAAAPTTAAVAAPTTTLAPTTTTTAKSKFAAASASVTTATTAKPAPATTTTVKPTTTTVKPTTTTTKPPAPATTVAAAAARPGDPASDASWEALAKCEAGGNWAANTGNGYYGGLQFSLATWQNLGGSGYPHQASKATQIALGRKLYARSGWNAWPGCAAKLGWT